MIQKIKGIYFSPAGSTAEIITHMVQFISKKLNLPYEFFSYTLPHQREQGFSFSKTDLVLWGTPVYAGRIPNKTLAYVTSAIHGQQSLAIPVVVYGNRSFDHALAELTHIMEISGCLPIAAAAVVARHSFSQTLAAGRPDAEDYRRIDAFCEAICENLLKHRSEEYWKAKNDDMVVELAIPGDPEPTAYYVPKKTDGSPARFLKAKPKVAMDRCIQCGKCVSVCPMGSISLSQQGYPLFEKICIKCQACIRQCPSQAIFMDDEDFLSHKKMVEENFMERKELSVYFL